MWVEVDESDLKVGDQLMMFMAPYGVATVEEIDKRRADGTRLAKLVRPFVYTYVEGQTEPVATGVEKYSIWLTPGRQLKRWRIE